ncbi:aldo/keto reductase [Streptacidiphilus pinicola]|uniref:Aldo/keto reductase n=1 Tax=Streptacidiphilus pinicola TaxID=2219663 RepID=A0A2X0JCY0_9ACTN|nr:aldo/keto reductase [Streptacidiphilus pinicola]RAG85478.1 aldo/keto reductase [Streptacidiphilus pinicola]
MTARLGLGLAAVGRPAYITSGRAQDLPGDRSPAALERRARELLDAAYELGIRHLDTARSYGRAEEFLAGWLHDHPDHQDLTVASKWGYTYTADWRTDAEVHEVKDHSVDAFERQIGETRAQLGSLLDLYQIHSVTPDSPALHDTALHHRLAELAAEGVLIGLSTSGPRQSDTILTALGLTVDGERLFQSFQTTWNLLEPSAGDALAEAHAAGCLVVVKEALANGRLVDPTGDEPTTAVLTRLAADLDTTPDAVALAAALRQPWVDVVLSGAVTPAQLAHNVCATTLEADPWQAGLPTPTEPAEQYWRRRSQRPWT